MEGRIKISVLRIVNCDVPNRHSVWRLQWGLQVRSSVESLKHSPLWILTILSLLKSPGRKKKSERRGWEEDEESAEKLGKSMQRKTQRPGVMEARRENESRR